MSRSRPLVDEESTDERKTRGVSPVGTRGTCEAAASPEDGTPDANPQGGATSTQAWQWSKVQPLFPRHGCSEPTCEFHRPPDCAGGTVFCCALNVSDALLRAGYTLPAECRF